MLQVSVIIPAYNEENRLEATLSSVYSYFKSNKVDFEIIVVSDGSTDKTVQLVEGFAAAHTEVRVIAYPINRGKGFAVKTGIMAANGEVVLIDDADGSSPIEEFARLNQSITAGAQIAIGSRAKPDPNCSVKALAHRTYIGNTFNRIVQSLLLRDIYDTQCGFKLFKNDIAKNIFSLSTIDGYAFDVEILYIARVKKYRIDEVSINWNNVSGSKVNIWLDSIKMLSEVLKISWKAYQGTYLEK